MEGLTSGLCPCSASPRGQFISAPEVELARQQRQDCAILEACLRRADASTIDAIEASFGDGVRTHAIRIACTVPAAHAWVHNELARSSEPSRATGFFTLETQLSGVMLVWGRSRRFTESHLASVQKIVLHPDTMFVPDPILSWVEAARLRHPGTEVRSCLGGGAD